jgi:RHS repeat-associated protein
VSVTQYGNGITSYLPAYDGNGNVMAMVRADTGSVEARYDYSPYGQTLTSTGSYAQENPFRFSTKYCDNETGLLYFGYRYYNSEMGRWVTRDPLEEMGGLNLYGFLCGDILDGVDYLGFGGYKLGEQRPPYPDEWWITYSNTNYNSETHTAALTAWVLSIIAKCKVALGGALATGMDHAYAGMSHYLANTGTNFTINYADFLTDDSESLRQAKKELADTIAWIEAHWHEIERSTVPSIVNVQQYTGKSSVTNWNGLVHEYYYWARAIQITSWCNDGKRYYGMKWDLFLEDFYDWDPRQDDVLIMHFLWPPEVSYLHYYGKAKTYRVLGTFGKPIIWKEGEENKALDLIP